MKIKLSKLKLTGDSPAVKARQRVEQTIALTAARALLDAGYSLGVNDGEETTIHHSKNLEDIKDKLFTTDEDWLLVFVKGDNRKDPRPQYWVRLVYGNDGWDVISDYSNHLDSVIGDGTKTYELIDRLSEDTSIPSLLLP